MTALASAAAQFDFGGNVTPDYMQLRLSRRIMLNIEYLTSNDAHRAPQSSHAHVVAWKARNLILIGSQNPNGSCH